MISTYAIHHLINKEKIKFIKSLSNFLNTNGKILIGDVSFETREELEDCTNRYEEIWDNDEIYLVFDEVKKVINDTYDCTYIKISHCSGILTAIKK